MLQDKLCICYQYHLLRVIRCCFNLKYSIMRNPHTHFFGEIFYSLKKNNFNFIESLFSDISSIFKLEDCPRKISILPAHLQATSQLCSLRYCFCLCLFLLAGISPSNLVPGGRNSGTAVAFVCVSIQWCLF